MKDIFLEMRFSDTNIAESGGTYFRRTKGLAEKNYFKLSLFFRISERLGLSLLL
jgi:hypothetical protein